MAVFWFVRRERITPFPESIKGLSRHILANILGLRYSTVPLTLSVQVVLGQSRTKRKF